VKNDQLAKTQPLMKQAASMVKVFNHAGETEFVSVVKHVQQYGEKI
jgi:hypothetical protein